MLFLLPYIALWTRCHFSSQLEKMHVLSSCSTSATPTPSPTIEGLDFYHESLTSQDQLTDHVLVLPSGNCLLVQIWPTSADRNTWV